MQKQVIDISTSTIIRFILVILAVIFLYLARDIALMIFAALVLAVAFDKPIDLLEKKGVPRFLGVIFVYVLLFAVVSVLVYLVFPVLAAQIKNLVTNYSLYLKKIGQLQPRTSLFNLKDLVNQFADNLTASAETIFGSLVSFFGGVVSFFTVFVVAIFLNLQETGVRKFIFYLAPAGKQNYILGLFDKIQQRVGWWLWGRIIMGFIMGALVTLGLYWLNIKYAVLLGVLAFILSFIPFVGPIISAVPSVLLGLAVSPVLALAVVLLYVVIHTVIENLILVPLLMKKAVDLNPAFIILILLLGGKLAGILGVIMAIPAAAIISVLVEEYIQRKKGI